MSKKKKSVAVSGPQEAAAPAARSAPPVSVAPAQPAVIASWILPLLVAIYTILCLALASNVEFGKAPDEAQHFEYVNYIAAHHQLPRFIASGGNSEPGYEFHQPPLYYCICSLWWHNGGTDDDRAWCRRFSIVCGALILVCLWGSVRQLFPQDPSLPIYATGFAALWPLHQNTCVAAGNDALAGLWCALIFWLMARAARIGWSLREAALLGVIGGLGILTKTTCLLVLLVAMGYAWWIGPGVEQKVTKLKQLAVSGGLVLLLAGWWLARNTVLYGDPLALGAFNARFQYIESSTSHLFEFGYEPLMLFKYVRGIVLLTFCTTWGIFGGPNTAYAVLQPFRFAPMNEAARAGLPAMLLCVVATAIAALGLVRWFKDRTIWTLRPAGRCCGGLSA